jgi:hypothetical protein
MFGWIIHYKGCVKNTNPPNKPIKGKLNTLKVFIRWLITEATKRGNHHPGSRKDNRTAESGK